jgi:hypothetical protein
MGHSCQCLTLFTLGHRRVPNQKFKLHCASKMWDMDSKEAVTSFLGWAIQANCTQLQDKCMSLLE